jgi:hypothetical protein
MINGLKKNLTKEIILSKISEYDIFKFYMPNSNWSIGAVTHSPFRNERTPSFIISSKDGQSLRYIDFGDTSKKGDCFNFVKDLYNISTFSEVLNKIDKDFNLGISSGKLNTDYKKIVKDWKQPEIIVKDYTFIQVKTRKFTNEELAYWNDYYQDVDDLKANNVFSISEVYLNKKRFTLNNNELRFGYLYNGHWKIYKPFAKNKRFKWVPNNVPITEMDGKDDIINCNTVFITKSKKDYMVMKKIYPNCCAVQNEGIGCFSEDNVNFIKDNSKKQILSFDSDETGVINSKLITDKFEFDYCNVPRTYLNEGIKDWADLAKIHGLKTIENYLIEKQIL